MAFSPAQIVQLKEFVKALKAAPELLHEDALSFFKDYLVSLGATIPEKKKREEKHEAPKPAEEPDDLPDLEPEFEPVPEEPEEEIVEPVDPSVIPAESDAPQQMGDLTAEVSDDNRDKAQELRGKATEHIAAGELNEAINVLTEAITKYNGSSAPLYASRGQCFLRLKKPASAIRDADTAIKINPDSAAPFKVRGRAKALLGQWSGAVADLKAANQRDYDPEINVVLKEISVKADEAAARQKKRDEQKQRREAKNKPASGGSSSGAGAGFGGGGFGGAGFGGAGAGFGGAKKGGPGGMPNIPPELLATLMQDPDVLAALGDPEVMPILNKLMTDPASVAQYKDHPKLGKLISKFAGMFPTGQQ